MGWQAVCNHDLMMPPRSLYFIQHFCDRCNGEFSKGRVMSFFTRETICLDCSRKEEEIRAKIREDAGAGADLEYEGCGFLPKAKRGGG